MIGPQKGYILAISRKGGYRIHPAMSNLAWSISRHIKYDYGGINLRTILGACLGHERAIFWPFLKMGLQDTPRIVKFGMQHSWECWLRFRKSLCKGTSEDHFWAIKGQHCSHFLERQLQDLASKGNFGMDRPSAYCLVFRKNPFEGPFEDNVLAIKGSYFGQIWDYWFIEW